MTGRLRRWLGLRPPAAVVRVPDNDLIDTAERLRACVRDLAPEDERVRALRRLAAIKRRG